MSADLSAGRGERGKAYVSVQDGNVDDWKRISDKSAAKILKQLEEHAKKEGFGETYMEFIKTNVIKGV